jgi:hypothetical protein
VFESDVNVLWVGAGKMGNMPSGIVSKPPKPVSSVSALPAWGLSGFFGRNSSLLMRKLLKASFSQ